MTIFEKGEETPLPYNKSDPRWKRYFISARKPSKEPAYTQNLLFQLYDQHLCNQIVRNHSAALPRG